jgi:hypothetical protein
MTSFSLRRIMIDPLGGFIKESNLEALRFVLKLVYVSDFFLPVFHEVVVEFVTRTRGANEKRRFLSGESLKVLSGKEQTLYKIHYLRVSHISHSPFSLELSLRHSSSWERHLDLSKFSFSCRMSGCQENSSIRKKTHQSWSR